MHHSGVDILTPGRPIVAQHNILLKRDYKKIKQAYRKQVIKKTAPLGCRFYIALPNGQQHLELICEHIAQENRALTKKKFNRSISLILDELVFAINETSYSRIERAIEMARKHSLPPDIALMLELLEEVNKNLIFWLESKSPFVYLAPDNKNKAWWQTSPKARGAALAIEHKIKRSFANRVPVQLDRFTVWLQDLEKNINKFCENISLGWSKSDAIKHASAYCAGIAERQLLHGNHDLSIMFYHRSVDLMLYSICAEQGLVNFSKNGGFGAYQSDLQKKITLNNSLDELSNHLNSSAARVQVFDDLNSWRNQLILTHYLTSSERRAIDVLAIKVRGELERLANPDWLKARDFFSSPPRISYQDIINVNNCISSLYKKSSL